MPTTATMIAAGARGNTPASAARNNGSRTRFNLRRDGVEECAEHISAAIRATRGLHGVYVDDRMDLRVISTTSTRQRPRSDTELVGTYRRGALVEHIEDDLAVGYHSLTEAAAKRFVNHGALDGSEYFIGKSVDVLNAALRGEELNAA